MGVVVQARLAAHRQLAEHGKQQRNALLDGATLRRRPAAGADQAQQTAEEEKASKAAATLKLQRMKAEMAAETERAAAALSVFAQSTGTLEKTNDKHERIGVGADKAEQLTTELVRPPPSPHRSTHAPLLRLLPAFVSCWLLLLLPKCLAEGVWCGVVGRRVERSATAR